MNANLSVKHSSKQNCRRQHKGGDLKKILIKFNYWFFCFHHLSNELSQTIYSDLDLKETTCTWTKLFDKINTYLSTIYQHGVVRCILPLMFFSGNDWCIVCLIRVNVKNRLLFSHSHTVSNAINSNIVNYGGRKFGRVRRNAQLMSYGANKIDLSLTNTFTLHNTVYLLYFLKQNLISL